VETAVSIVRLRKWNLKSQIYFKTVHAYYLLTLKWLLAMKLLRKIFNLFNVTCLFYVRLPKDLVFIKQFKSLDVRSVLVWGVVDFCQMIVKFLLPFPLQRFGQPFLEANTNITCFETYYLWLNFALAGSKPHIYSPIRVSYICLSFVKI